VQTMYRPFATKIDQRTCIFDSSWMVKWETSKFYITFGGSLPDAG
jgi:hypothetical protein